MANGVTTREVTEKDRAACVSVSVIVPVYNTAPYLPQCLNSILDQTLSDIEVICVDDGSTDSSWEILSSYAEKDDRLVLIRQENKFAGVARNKALSVARGKYLVFWDSDDFFDRRALACLFDRCEETNADVCVCGANRYYQAENRLVPHDKYLVKSRVPQVETFDRHSNADYLFSFTTVMVWNKMYRRSFIEECGLRFQPRRNSNDVYFSLCALGLARRICVVDDYLISYRIARGGSLVSSLEKDPTATAEAMADARERLAGLDSFPEYDYFYKVISVLRHSFNQLDGTPGSETLKRYLAEGGARDLGLTGRPITFYLGWLWWMARRRIGH